MTEAELELLRAVALDAPEPGLQAGEAVRVRYSSAAHASGPRPRWERVGPGEIVGRIDNLLAPSSLHEQGTFVVYGAGAVVALRFPEVVAVGHL